MQSYTDYYRQRFGEILGAPPKPEDGIGEEAVREQLEKAGLRLPQALFDYYAVAGAHEINSRHNYLFPIDRLERVDGFLVFMEENQAVVFWGVKWEDLESPDPMVWQGANAEHVEWYSEGFRVSRFIAAMWKWVETGELEKPERDE